LSHQSRRRQAQNKKSHSEGRPACGSLPTEIRDNDTHRPTEVNSLKYRCFLRVFDRMCRLWRPGPARRRSGRIGWQFGSQDFSLKTWENCPMFGQ
jgi:hypothetical protein